MVWIELVLGAEQDCRALELGTEKHWQNQLARSAICRFDLIFQLKEKVLAN